MTNRFITNMQVVYTITYQHIQMFLNVTPVTRCDTVTLYRNITIKLNHLPIVVIYMEDINSINYIHITTVNQEKNTPTSEMNRVISSNKERNEIHSSSQLAGADLERIAYQPHQGHSNILQLWRSNIVMFQDVSLIYHYTYKTINFTPTLWIHFSRGQTR